MRINVLLLVVLLSNVTWASEEQGGLKQLNFDEVLRGVDFKSIEGQVESQSSEIYSVAYLVKPTLIYPKNMQDFGNRGKAMLRFFVNKEGGVKEVITLDSAHPDIEQVAVQGMLKAKFYPTPEAWEGQQPIFLTGYQGALSNESVDPFKIPKASKDLPEEFQYDEPPVIKVAAPVVYPLTALKGNKKGKAKIYVVIDSNGVVRSVKTLSATSPEFGLAAKASFQSWQFYPAKKNKQNSWSVIVKDFDFNLYNRDTKPSESAARILFNLKKGKDNFASMQNLDYIPKPRYAPLPRNVSEGQRNNVVLAFYLDQDGFVQLPEIVSAEHDEQAWLALTALKRWQFEIPMINGKPVVAKLTLPLDFK